MSQYILVVMAEDQHGNEMESPMEIQVVVEDINDNMPQCESEESVFEIQEHEPVGKICLHVIVRHFECLYWNVTVNKTTYPYPVFCSVIGCGGGVAGSLVGQLLAYDPDEEGTGNALLLYAIASQQPANGAFSIDAISGRIQNIDLLQRKEAIEYTLMVTVSDTGNAHMHTHTHTHPHTQTHTHTHRHTHTHTHMHAHVHPHTHACTHTQTHTRAQTHTLP